MNEIPYPSISVTLSNILKITHKAFVYTWIRNNKHLYIGFTTKGVSRFDNHHIIKNGLIEVDDVFNFYYCDTLQQLRNLEKSLIRRFNPTYNTMKYKGTQKQLMKQTADVRRLQQLNYKKSLYNTTTPSNIVIKYVDPNDKDNVVDIKTSPKENALPGYLMERPL